MKPSDLRLISVNWEHGMLLTPDHFLRQEQYFESNLYWFMRYASGSYGLVGGGPRLAESERGAVKHDPIVILEEDGDSLKLSVTQCRGLTPSGWIVEIDAENPVHSTISKSDMEGIAESTIYVASEPFDKQTRDGEVDPFNPQMKTERRAAYSLSLGSNAEKLANSVAVARVRRQRAGVAFEKVSDFIPPCTSLVAFSELNAAWRKITESVAGLLSRYTELHRAMREFLTAFTERGIDTEVDGETLRFVDRMVVALEDCAFATLDPTQSPQQFFGAMRKFLHSAATYMDLTPAVYQYFETLRDTGEMEFVAPLEQQRELLSAHRSWRVSEDLGVEVRSVVNGLRTLNRLEQALEGKYIDFRISPSLEAMNFIFDRGGRVLYRLAAKPARVQGAGAESTIYFSQLRLEGRDKYRLILVGEQNGGFEKGTGIKVEIRINEGSGFRREPLRLECQSKYAGQMNFEFDFEASDVPTITDLRASIPAHYPIKSALLFIRHRFFAGGAQDMAAHAVPPVRSAAAEAGARSARGAYTAPEPERSRPIEPGDSREPVFERARPAPPVDAGSGTDFRRNQKRDAWEDSTVSRAEEERPAWDEPPRPPRRRRLE